MAKFDATDLKYQVSEDYKPDKTSTWHHPEEKDGWVIGTFAFLSCVEYRTYSAVAVASSLGYR
jgi:hypothetical protein